jgi:hypothetical protein
MNKQSSAIFFSLAYYIWSDQPELMGKVIEVPSLLTFYHLVVATGTIKVKFLEDFSCKPGLCFFYSLRKFCELLWRAVRSLSLEAFNQR